MAETLEQKYGQIREQVGRELPVEALGLQARIQELSRKNDELRSALEAVTDTPEKLPEPESTQRPEQEERRMRDPRVTELEHEIGRLMDEVARGAATLQRVKLVLQGAHEEVQRLTRENQDLRKKAEEHERLSQTDELTGLLNRHAFKTLAPSLFEMYKGLARQLNVPSGTENRTGSMDVSFNAIYIDLNGFKEINDKIGHAAGDEALKRVAGALRSAVRSTDPVFRMGGDEFLILFMSREKPGAMQVDVHTNRFIVAERIKRALTKTGFPFTGMSGPVEVPPLTAMLGVAQYTAQGGEGLNEVVQSADAEALKLKELKEREKTAWEEDPTHEGVRFPYRTQISYAQDITES